MCDIIGQNAEYERFELPMEINERLISPGYAHPLLNEHWSTDVISGGQASDLCAGDDDFQSPLDYLRDHGLAVDYLSIPLPLDEISKLRETIDCSVIENPDLGEIELPPGFTIGERLVVNKDAARVLASLRDRILSTDILNSAWYGLAIACLAKRSKADLPLLRTDNEHDLREFAAWDQNSIENSDINLPIEPLDDDRNEGLGWPSMMLTLPDRISTAIAEERLEVSKPILLFLQSNIKDTWREDDDRLMWDFRTSRKRTIKKSHVTPSLLPVLPGQITSDFSSPNFQLSLLSDPPSLLSTDIRLVENEICEEILQTPIATRSPTMGLDSDPNDGLVVSGKSFHENHSESRIAKAATHKVETPLTPSTLANPVPMVIGLKEAILEIRPEPSQNSCLPDESPLVDHFFKDAFQSYADTVERKIEQEQLQDADTTKRVAIPILDFTLPDPPWKVAQKLRHNTGGYNDIWLAVLTEVALTCGLPARQSILKQSEVELRWSPFPAAFGKPMLDEKFGNEELIRNHLLFVQSSVVESGDLAWKAPGLSILRDQEDDGEMLDFGNFLSAEPQALDSLVAKHSLRRSEGGAAHNSTLSRQGLVAKESTNMDKSLDPDEVTEAFGCVEHSSFIHNSNSLLGRPFSAIDSIDHFLEMRGHKRQKTSEQSHVRLHQAVAPSQLARPTINHVEALEPARTITPLPVPMSELTFQSSAAMYIISSALLKRRNLIKALERLLPNATLIERYFDAYNTTLWRSPATILRTAEVSPLAAEADVIVSPSTGVILTTLDLLKQKALPSQKSLPAIRSRVQKVALRYERLLILVSSDARDAIPVGSASRPCLDGPSVFAIADFTGFCSSLDTTIIVRYIPTDGDASLAPWLAACITQYAVSEIAVALRQDETLWDLFLRRAGLNAYAAQVIVGEMRAPEGVGAAKGGFFGLAGFVEMGHRARVARFAGLLGGRRVLERVAACLDGAWA